MFVRLFNTTWNNQFFPTTNLMKEKHEEESFRFCRKKTFSSFICWAEILKSFHFFATLFPSFREVSAEKELSCFPSHSQDEGRVLQGQMVCSQFINVAHVCSFLKNVAKHAFCEWIIRGMNSRNVLGNVEWKFHNRNISPVQGPAAATIVHQAGTRTTFGLRLELLASLEKTIPKAHFCHHLSKQHFVQFSFKFRERSLKVTAIHGLGENLRLFRH